MGNNQFREFELSGVLCTGDHMFSYDDFMDAFIDMIEARGWSYGGSWKALDANGEPVPYDPVDRKVDVVTGCAHTVERKSRWAVKEDERA